MFSKTYESTNFERFNDNAPGVSVSGNIISRTLSRKEIWVELKNFRSAFGD